MANSTPDKNKHSIISQSWSKLASKNDLARVDGRVVTVKDFLEDVKLLQANQKPKFIKIGRQYT
jgi:hypothetical protein